MKKNNLKPQVFLIPFAGGSSYSFSFMKENLTDYDMITLELPGRGKRIGESILYDFSDALEDLYQQVLVSINPTQVLLYGHSLGALSVLEIARLLQKNGKLIKAIVVTGNAGPGTGNTNKRHLLPPNEFKQELKQLGGMPQEILNDKETFAFFEPIIRADFQIGDSYKSSLHACPLTIPIYAMMGGQESKTDEIENWKSQTVSDFTFQIVQGGHFFIFDNASIVSDLIKCAFNADIPIRD